MTGRGTRTWSGRGRVQPLDQLVVRSCREKLYTLQILPGKATKSPDPVAEMILRVYGVMITLNANMKLECSPHRKCKIRCRILMLLQFLFSFRRFQAGSSRIKFIHKAERNVGWGSGHAWNGAERTESSVSGALVLLCIFDSIVVWYPLHRRFELGDKTRFVLLPGFCAEMSRLRVPKCRREPVSVGLGLGMQRALCCGWSFLFSHYALEFTTWSVSGASGACGKACDGRMLIDSDTRAMVEILTDDVM